MNLTCKLWFYNFFSFWKSLYKRDCKSYNFLFFWIKENTFDRIDCVDRCFRTLNFSCALVTRLCPGTLPAAMWGPKNILMAETSSTAYPVLFFTLTKNKEGEELNQQCQTFCWVEYFYIEILLTSNCIVKISTLAT